MNKEIAVKGKFHIIIEEDFRQKKDDNPYIPPILKIYLYIPNFYYIELDNYSDSNEIRIFKKLINPKTFGFQINRTKNLCNELQICLEQLKYKFHINIDIKDMYERIKNLYLDYFRFGEINIRLEQSILVSKEYIKDRLKEEKNCGN